MNKLEAILHKRLEKIRGELNSYIKKSYCGDDPHAVPASIVEKTPEQEKADDMQVKYLHCMRICDAGFNDADHDDKEAFLPDEVEDKALPEPVFDQIPKSQKTAKDAVSGKPEINDSHRIYGKRQELDKILEQKEESFSTMLLRMIDEKGLKDTEVYKRANIDRRLFSKIRGDEKYVPSKKTAIAFCLALQLEMEEAKKLLETAGYTLSASSRFDLIIMYLIENYEYNIHFVNIVLDDYGEGTLSR